MTWAQIAGAGRTGSGNASACEWHVFSGHASGEVIMWEPRNNSLQPVLHLGRQRRAVRALVVCEELSLLCAGHESGTVGWARQGRGRGACGGLHAWAERTWREAGSPLGAGVQGGNSNHKRPWCAW